MRFTNTSKKVLTYAYRMLGYAVVGFSVFRLMISIPRIHAFTILASLLVFTGYRLVLDEERNNRHLLGLNFLCVQSAVYHFATGGLTSHSSGIILLSLVVGLFVWLAVNVVSVIVVGSVMYGGISNFSEEIEEKTDETHSDPYGDKHAQRILESAE